MDVTLWWQTGPIVVYTAVCGCCNRLFSWGVGNYVRVNRDVNFLLGGGLLDVGKIGCDGKKERTDS